MIDETRMFLLALSFPVFYVAAVLAVPVVHKYLSGDLNA
jgi:hypothetical protein